LCQLFFVKVKPRGFFKKKHLLLEEWVLYQPYYVLSCAAAEGCGVINRNKFYRLEAAIAMGFSPNLPFKIEYF